MEAKMMDVPGFVTFMRYYAGYATITTSLLCTLPLSTHCASNPCCFLIRTLVWSVIQCKTPCTFLKLMPMLMHAQGLHVDLSDQKLHSCCILWHQEQCGHCHRWADKLSGQTLKHVMPLLAYTLREPLGVCALIVPWNFPLGLLGMKLAPALAAGNTVVAKVKTYVCSVISKSEPYSMHAVKMIACSSIRACCDLVHITVFGCHA